MREFLKGLNLDKETVNKIMAEHGKHITQARARITELRDAAKQYKTQVEQTSKSLKDLQTLTNQNKTLTSENENLKAQLLMTDSNVKKEFNKFVTSEIMSKVDNDNDFASVLKTYKEENPQYFGESVVKKVQSSPTLNGGVAQPQTTNDIMNDILRGATE